MTAPIRTPVEEIVDAERARVYQLPRVAEDGCYTLPDGECVGCPHCAHGPNSMISLEASALRLCLALVQKLTYSDTDVHKEVDKILHRVNRPDVFRRMMNER